MVLPSANITQKQVILFSEGSCSDLFLYFSVQGEKPLKNFRENYNLSRKMYLSNLKLKVREIKKLMCTISLFLRSKRQLEYTK